MTTQRSVQPGVRALGSNLVLFSIMLIILSCIPQPAAQPRVPHAQAALLDLARASPDAMVRVIVQQEAQSSAVAATITTLGGVITHDLTMINALAVTLPAQALPVLARSEGVGWVSLDAPLSPTTCRQCIKTSKLRNVYPDTIGATKLWNKAPYLQGQGITVAVVDSGINDHDDLKDTMNGNTRITAWEVFNNSTQHTPDDYYGHGTHVAGIVGGNGSMSGGEYIGVAPRVNLVNVKVSNNNQGAGTTAELIAGLQWIYDHKDQYNIRVVTLSLNSSVAEPYQTSPLSAAVEVLWFNKIVVVVSAGNNGFGVSNGILFPPANDPFVITVGATDDRGTATSNDDQLAPFSSYGITESGFAKPDLVAPGTNIVSLLGKPDGALARAHPDHLQRDSVQSNYFYFRMSGTSMSAPMVAGAVALLLQDEPHLTPDQVKYRLRATARPLNMPGTGAGSLDIAAAVYASTTESANTGVVASQLLWSGTDPATWSSVNWNSVNWNSVNWNSVNWNSVNWNSVNWNSDYWGN